MKKAFTVVLRSKETEIADGKLKTALKEAISKNLADDVRVVVNRAKDLDPAK